MLIKKDPFDYTKWQEDLFEDMSLEEIHDKSTELWLKKSKISPQIITKDG
jgi:hypothetical protein